MISLLKTIFRSAIAVILCVLLLLNLLIMPLPIFILAFISLCIPLKKIRHNIFNAMNKLLLAWQHVNYWIVFPVIRNHIDFPDTSSLNKKNWYVMIANHRTWFDILVIGCALRTNLPPLKFFMKRSLLWTLPLGGLGCYLLGFPFLRRHTARQIKKNPQLKNADREMMNKACHVFKKIPTTSITFAEGTRITDKKHHQQKSPYKHLLRPKAGGVATVLYQLRKELHSVIDVTIHYSGKATFWRVLCGKTKRITVRFVERPLPEIINSDYYVDRSARAPFQKWLNDLWTEKDELLQQLTEKEQKSKQ